RCTIRRYGWDANWRKRIIREPRAGRRPRQTRRGKIRLAGSHMMALLGSLASLVSTMIVVVSGSRDRDHRAGLLVEDQSVRAALVPVVEVEHVVERAGDGVERAAPLNALAGKPGVRNEPEP